MHHSIELKLCCNLFAKLRLLPQYFSAWLWRMEFCPHQKASNYITLFIFSSENWNWRFFLVFVGMKRWKKKTNQSIQFLLFLSTVVEKLCSSRIGFTIMEAYNLNYMNTTNQTHHSFVIHTTKAEVSDTTNTHITPYIAPMLSHLHFTFQSKQKYNQSSHISALRVCLVQKIGGEGF